MGSFIRILSITLPWVFMPLAAAALLFALYYFWQSLRAALGLVSTADIPGVVESETRRVLIEKKKALLEGLADLKFERDAGKISDDDYERLDAELRVKAKRVLKLLDEDVRPFRRQAVAMIAERLSSTSRAPYRVKGVPIGSEDPVDGLDPVEAPEILRVFDDIMEQYFGVNAEQASDEVSADEVSADAGKASESAEPDALHCSSCGTRNDLDAEFCKKCGSALGAQADESGADAAADGEAEAGDEADADADARDGGAA